MADERGRLVVTDRALRALAEHAAAGVPGTVAAAHGLPSAAVTTAGDHVRAQVQVALAWPQPAAATAAAVRAAVADALGRLGGQHVDTVAVRLADVVAAPRAQRERVR